MGKRDTTTDVPIRIYRTTFDRINLHRETMPKPQTRTTRGRNKFIKADFNKFIELLLDVYEGLQTAEVFYATKLYKDPSEARGEAILQAVKSKTPVEFPKMVVVMGEDDQS